VFHTGHRGFRGLDADLTLACSKKHRARVTGERVKKVTRDDKSGPGLHSSAACVQSAVGMRSNFHFE
jgi:hypothetical protein